MIENNCCTALHDVKILLMIRLSSDSFPQLQWTGSWRVRGLQCLSLPFTSNEEAVMLHLSSRWGGGDYF